ncbi:MAG: hypothetical protein ABEK16_05500 [Candidatus Nanohalobium sp.]
MKKTALFTALVLTTFSTAAFVGYSGPKNQPHALSTTDDSASQSNPETVRKSGSEWALNFTERAAGPVNQSTGVNNYSFNGTSLSISGTVQIPQPCYELNVDLNEIREDSYTFNVTTERKGNGTLACADVISYRKYEATFHADMPFKMKVVHDGETIRTLEHPDYTAEKEKNKGPIASFLRIISGLL